MALAIEGFMDHYDLEWLAEQALTHHRIVEVGSYLGRSTRALADHTPGWVVAFDDWYGPREKFILEQTEDGETIATELKVDRENAFSTFQQNLSDHISSGKVRIVRGDHSEFFRFPPEWVRGTHQPEDRPDMVFIDGSHEYPDVKRDILGWYPRVARGGLLCGHDCSCDAVMRVLLELFGKVDAVPFTDIWSVNV